MTAAELKAAWLEALKSGKYPFGRNFHWHAGCFCALGVLSKVFEPDEDPNYSSAHRAATQLNMIRGEDSLWCQLTKLNDEAEDFSPVIQFIEEHVHV